MSDAAADAELDRAAAFHEAGHAVVAIILDLPCDGATIGPAAETIAVVSGDNPLFGHDLALLDKATITHAESMLAVQLAGYIAESMHAPVEDTEEGARGDFLGALQCADVLAQQVFAELGAKDYYAICYRRAARIILRCEDVVAGVAELLLAERTVSRNRIIEAIGIDRMLEARASAASVVAELPARSGNAA